MNPRAELAERIALLCEVPLLADLPARELALLADRLISRPAKKGQVLLYEGDPPLGLLLIKSGLVKASKALGQGHDQTLGIHGRADVLGTLSTFDGRPHPATLVALTEVEAYLLYREAFQSLVGAHPEIALRIIQILSERLRHAYDHLGPLALQTVPQRLGRLLLRFAQQEGRGPAGETEVRVELSVTRATLAELVGASRETITRELQRLQRQKVLRIEGRRLTIVGVEQLRWAAGLSDDGGWLG